MRALLAFLAAQSALLYGYSLWGGIKELTAAFLLVLGAALAAADARRAAGALARAAPAGDRRRRADPDARGGRGRLGGAGAGVVAVGWLVRRARRRAATACGPSVRSIAWLAGLTAVFVVPVWVVLGRDFLTNGH